MTAPSTQDDLTRLDQLTEWAMTTERIQVMSGLHGAPLHRTAALFAVATVIVNSDLRCALQYTERCLESSRGNPSEAMRLLHGYLPMNQRRQYGDGSVVKATLRTLRPSRHLVPGRDAAVADTREQAAAWSIRADAQVRWRHQLPDPWRPIGRILGVEHDSVTTDMAVWMKVLDADVVEEILYRRCSISPGIAASSPATYGYSHDFENTRLWTNAEVAEISICLREEAALDAQLDLVPTVPVAAADAWAQRTCVDHEDTPHPRDHPHPADYPQGYVHPVTRTPSGLPMQQRYTPGGLRVM